MDEEEDELVLGLVIQEGLEEKMGALVEVEVLQMNDGSRRTDQSSRALVTRQPENVRAALVGRPFILWLDREISPPSAG